MARGDIRQPNSRIFSPSARRVASAPSQETSASGTTVQQDFRRGAGAANQMMGQYARTKVQEQKEIDIADKHQYLRNKAKYVPEIKKQIEEQNLEGAPAEEVMAHVRDSEEFQTMFSGFKDTDNLEKYQKDFLANMEGQALEWQATYEEQQRGRMFVEAVTAGLAESKPEDRPQLVKEFYQDAVDMDGPYKRRPEEVQEVIVGLAQQYNQAEQYDKAKDLLENTEFDEGFKSQAGIQLTGAENGIEQVRLEKAQAEYKDLSYGLHNSPETTSDQARQVVENMDSEGLFKTPQQKEAHYDWIMSGREKAQGRSTLFGLLERDPPKTREALEVKAEGLAKLYGVQDKDKEMAVERWVEKKYAKNAGRYYRLMGQANEDGTFDDPELQQEAEVARERYMESLRYAPLATRTEMTELATLAKNPDGNFSPQEIQQLGQRFDDMTQAFGGNRSEAIKTYFPGDGNKDTRGRLMTMALLKDASGGSWDSGYKLAVENRKAGPSAEHSSWQDNEAFNDLMTDFEDAYGTEYKAEFKTYLKTMRGAPMDAAFDAAVGMIAADYTHIERSGWNDDEFRLKGPNGKVFFDSFKQTLKEDEAFGPWVDENGNTVRHKEPFRVLKDYVQVKAKEWERHFEELNPNMEFELNDPDEAFTEEGSIIVTSHPTKPGALTIRHRNGTMLAPQVMPQDITRRLSQLPKEEREDGSTYLYERY